MTYRRSDGKPEGPTAGIAMIGTLEVLMIGYVLVTIGCGKGFQLFPYRCVAATLAIEQRCSFH